MKHDTPKIITIYLKNSEALTCFGWYRRDLEKPNWHYYESTDGTMYHCRKDEMVAVVEKEMITAQEVA